MNLPSIPTIQTTPFPAIVELATTVVTNCDGNKKLTQQAASLLPAFLESSAGTRGIFVALLSNTDESYANADDSSIIQALCRLQGNSADEARTLAVKNVVMSVAMVNIYKEKGEEELANNSNATSTRAIQLLKAWYELERGEEFLQVGKEMVKGLEEEVGKYASFGTKWGYGKVEREMAVKGLYEALGQKVTENGK